MPQDVVPAKNLKLSPCRLHNRTVSRIGSVDPEVLQSGFGVNLLSWSGEFEENSSQIYQRISSANFFCEFFGLASPGFQPLPPPKKNSPPKFTPRFVGIPLQFRFFEHEHFPRRFCACGGDQQVMRCLCDCDGDSQRHGKNAASF